MKIPWAIMVETAANQGANPAGVLGIGIASLMYWRACRSDSVVGDAATRTTLVERRIGPEVEGNLALLAVHPVRRHALDTAKHIPGDGRSAASFRGGCLPGGRWPFVGGPNAGVT